MHVWLSANRSTLLAPESSGALLGQPRRRTSNCVPDLLKALYARRWAEQSKHSLQPPPTLPLVTSNLSPRTDQLHRSLVEGQLSIRRLKRGVARRGLVAVHTSWHPSPTDFIAPNLRTARVTANFQTRQRNSSSRQLTPATPTTTVASAVSRRRPKNNHRPLHVTDRQTVYQS